MLQAARRCRLLIVASLLAFGPAPSEGQPPKPKAMPEALNDPALAPLRLAARSWEGRPGPTRAVVDQVCLVPDVPTFLAALATWDRSRCFPILIDDAESNARFIRAFRPARVVRFPNRAEAKEGDALWAEALAAVGRSWAADGAEPPKADARPEGLGPTPPGVVVSSPGAAGLAAAAALAAGRFQPLLRWEPPGGGGVEVEQAEAEALARGLMERVAAVTPSHRGLGDDCDFVTLAADAPFRYKSSNGPCAIDDLLGRAPGAEERWAYVGRMVGDAPTAVYAAMCSLFIRPERALLFNTYQQAEPPWTAYGMLRAADRLSRALPVSHNAGPSGRLADWNEAFDPVGRFGLVLVNSNGNPSEFGAEGGPGTPADIPPGVPSVVSMIHSFSAADPTDPATIAGRWLANGAFVYYGSMYEPYLMAFRVPNLVAEAIAAGWPISAAVRQSSAEPFGTPWRLVYLGDPLYRLRGQRAFPTRSDAWGESVDWPEYAAPPQPPQPSAGDAARLAWALRASIHQWKSGRPAARGSDLPSVLGSIRRDRLAPAQRPVLDALVVDLYLEARRTRELLTWLLRIAPGERSPIARRALEVCGRIELDRAASRGDFAAARPIWEALVRSEAAAMTKRRANAKMAELASGPASQAQWRNAVRAALNELGPDPAGGDLEKHLEAVEKKVQGSGARR